MCIRDSLSNRRALAVRAYLMTKGVAEGRLSGRGFGPDRPIESNTSSRGRAANRRVEFHLVGPGGASVQSGGTVSGGAAPAAGTTAPAAGTTAPAAGTTAPAAGTTAPAAGTTAPASSGATPKRAAR